MEAMGNYLTLYKVNNEIESLENKLQIPVYDHAVGGATRVIFLDQSCSTDTADLVVFKQLKKKDFAMNINGLAAARR